ncbi:MAG: MBL fold metallo-hydrolase [Gemmatimonadota bacterium]|nr:MBL fold metallo-hydrolase [Gemmatimonadota bacterium]
MVDDGTRWKAGVTAVRYACQALLVLLALPAWGAAQAICSDAPLAVQVLGSGGPFAGSRRASSSYLVWAEGRAIALIDVGGGSFLRFGEAGASLDDLSVVAISHLHPDHVSDLPGLLWLSDSVRERPLVLVGPSAGGVFPDIATFARRLFDGTDGAFPILSGSVGGPGRGVLLDVREIDVTRSTSTVIDLESGLELWAIGVPHASIGVANATTPSVAYRLRLGDRSVVFSSDQNGSDERFVSFAADADVLVMHMAVSERNVGEVHARPSVVGRIAQDANVRRLVLSHLIEPPEGLPEPDRFSGSRLEESVALVEAAFTGPLDVATDLLCIRVR